MSSSTLSISDSPTPGEILIHCKLCNGLYPIPDFRHSSVADILMDYYENSRTCPACAAKLAEQTARAAAEAARAANADLLPDLLAEAGIPSKYSHDRSSDSLFSAPPVRFLAEYIWRNRNRNLLISGITGSGKSTSAGFVASRLLAEGAKLRYSSLRSLLADWRDAKTSKSPYASERLLKSITALDYFIIDEVVGKNTVTDSGQELLFALLEAVASGQSRARIWLLGNFYRGSIEALFSDPDPVRRRLQENFLCVYADRSASTVTPLSVWN